jgi:hypothetical protein
VCAPTSRISTLLSRALVARYIVQSLPIILLAGIMVRASRLSLRDHSP